MPESADPASSVSGFSPSSSGASASAAAPCFHCGEPLPSGCTPTVRYRDRDEPVCCLGCQAVATTIIEGGFDAYYQRRQAWASTGGASNDARRYALYDDPAFQQRFVQHVGDDEQEVVLAIDGMHCASCVWLAEHAVGRESGIAAFDVNLMTRRARLRWHPSRLALSRVLQALGAVGLQAEPYDQARRDERVESERRRGFRQLFIAGLGMMQVMMYVWPQYVSGKDIEAEYQNLMTWASLWMTLPVMLYSAQPMLLGAWRDLRQRRLGMDVPVALAIIVAFVASAWNVWRGQGEVYFDSITMFVFLLLAARQLELRARARAVDALDDFMRLRPHEAVRITADGGRQTVPVEQLQTGDRIDVASSGMLPADGLLLAEAAEFDLSLLTGESLPVVRKAGDALPAGAVNCGAPVEVRLSSPPGEGALSLITRLIDRAAADKPRIARLADRAARQFLVALLLITLVVALVWLWIDPGRVLPIVISLLVVSCPCALSLAMPAALAAATSSLARRGALVARMDAIEALAQATTVVFDKTGTLTQARAVLARLEPVGGGDRTELLGVAAALEAGSSHPLGRAVLDAAAGLSVPLALERQLVAGQGVQGTVAGREWRIGRPEFVSSGCEAPPHDEGATLVALGSENQVRAWLHLQAPLRRGASGLATQLQALGLSSQLLSGDRQAAVDVMCQRLHIPQGQGDMSPEDKLAAVQALQAQGARVAMVGDGINDSPVLSAADVSIALGDGTELAQISADVILMSDDVATIARAVQLSRRALRIIRQNLVWATAYNCIAIPVAALGWLSPWQSALGMSLSSLLVVANALRLIEPHRRSD